MDTRSKWCLNRLILYIFVEMKKIIPIVLTFMATVIGVSCSRQAKIDDQYPWSATRHDFDSLVIDIERRHMTRDHDWGRQLGIMDSIATADGHLPLKWRTLFFKAICGYVGGGNNASDPMEMLGAAIDMCDSMRYTYDYNRMLDIRARIDPAFTPLQSYKVWSRLYDWAGERGLTMWQANLMNQMANAEQEAGLYESALEHTEKAQKLFNKSGNTLFAGLLMLNKANALSNLGRTSEADSIYEVLRKDKRTRDDTTMQILINLNIYYNSNDTSCLGRALSLLPHHHNRLAYLPAIYNGMAAAEFESGNLGNAIKWVGRSLAIRDSISDVGEQANIQDIYMKVYGRAGLIKDPVAEHDRYVRLQDSARRVMSAANLDRFVVAEHIKDYIRSEQERQRSSQIVMIVAIVLLVLLTLAVVLYFRQRTLGYNLLKARAELDLERSRKKALTLQMMLDENVKVISTIEQKLDSMPDGSAPELKSMLKLGRMNTDDWQSFDAFFEQVHPRFQRALREKFGIRSESRIKLACYIWMGLSSKQIAKLLMIEPMSVMKSRYRLRQQMNLAQGESLEQALSKLE